MAHILVTGGQGQVGRELARIDWPAGVALHLPERNELDLTSRRAVEAFLAAGSYDAIINCAAFTAVDKAESTPEEAFVINGEAPGWLAASAIPLIQVSTDYVFDGSKPAPYVEDDPVAPLGVYGQSKLEGERAVLSGRSRAIVLRTAWVLSPHRGNFLKTMLRLAGQQDKLRVVEDQHGCPTSARDIASALAAIVQRLIADRDAPTGVYHFVNGGEASWCDLAREIFAISAAAGGPSADVEGIGTADYPTAARRPANSRLSTAKISADFGIMPRDWRLAVREIMEELGRTGGLGGTSK